MSLKDLVYAAWESPDTVDIEDEVVVIVETQSKFEGDIIDQLVNRIFNISDVEFPDSREWIEKVMDEVDYFLEEFNEE